MPVNNSVTVTNGSSIVTGYLTTFVGAPGDLFVIGSAAIPIQSVQGTGQLTLAWAWPGTTATDRTDYQLLKTGDYWGDNVTTFIKVNELLDKIALGLPLSIDAAGPSTARANYNTQPPPFRFLATTPAPATLYVKTGTGPTDWSPGIILASQVVQDAVDARDAAAASAAAAATSQTNAANSATLASQKADVASAGAGQVNSALVGLYVREYFVDSSATDDTKDGTSPANALKTLTAAVARMQAGDVLWVRAGGGRYRADSLIFPAHTHVMTYDGGNRAIIDFSKQVPNNSFSAVSGSANVYKITVDMAALFPNTHQNGLLSLFQQTYPTIFEGVPEDDPKGLMADGKRMRCVNGTFNYIFGWGDAGYTKAQGIAAVQGEPGSFFVMNGNDTTITTNANGTVFDFYVHPPGSTNPITNAKEYSIASGREDGWWQRQGGSCSGLWFTRTAHKNAFQFDGAACSDLKFSHYPLHGCFHNSCVVENCESYALQRGGACFHGYRDPGVAPDRGLIYRGCITQGGAWAFFSHSAGGSQAQLSTLLEDCTVRDCVHPISPDAVQGFIARRCRFLGVRSVVSSGKGLYEDCFWELHGRAEDENIPAFGAGGRLRNCTVQGGRAFRRAFQNVSNADPLFVEQSTVNILDDQDIDSSAFVHLTDSVWTIGFVVTATKTYTDGTLDHLGNSPTNTSVTNCYSRRRKMSVPRVASGTVSAATIRVWPKDLTTFCIPDWLNGDLAHGANRVTLYATTAADRDLIKVGVPIWLYQDGQKVMDSGIYLVTAVSADTAPRVTLDRPVVLPSPLSFGVNYLDNSEGIGLGGGVFTEAAPMPRLELRLPQITQIPSGFKITLSGGTVFTADANGFLPSGNNILASNSFRPTVTFDPVVAGEETGTATLEMIVNVADLAPSWVLGPDGMRRLSGYLRDLGVGSTL